MNKLIKKTKKNNCEFSKRISHITKIYVLFWLGMVGYVVPGLG